MTARLLRTATLTGPLLALLVAWLPIARHYYPGRIDISPDVIQRSIAAPDDAVLAELERMTLLPPGLSGQDKSVIEQADHYLRGEAIFSGIGRAPIRLPLQPSDLTNGSSEYQLMLAGFMIPRILIDAFEATGRRDHLDAAAAFIESWAALDRSLWLPTGLAWNDHATASRIFVLADFWRLYRKQPGFQPAVATAVLTTVARDTELLTRSDLFNIATNHGVMANAAIFQAALVFPAIPGIAAKRDLAFDRLRMQLDFYLSDEGVILEHSASYQLFGLELLALVFKQLSMMGQPVPDGWWQKYQRAIDVYDVLRRPDGSLPSFGDTEAGPRPYRPLVAERRDSAMQFRRYEPRNRSAGSVLWPVSGYAVWWDRATTPPAPKSELSQTVVTWSNFEGHAHKHADELGVLFWADGQNWVTHTGYWQWDTRGREEAEGWDGANAPHLVDEPPDSQRDVRLVSVGSTPGLEALDLQRVGPDAATFRRQVIHAGSSRWLVLDTKDAPKAPSRVTWTFGHDVKTGSALDNTFWLEGPASRTRVLFGISGSAGTQVQQVRGSWSPFAGWEVTMQSITQAEAPAIVVEQPPGRAWLATAWTLDRDGNIDTGGSWTPAVMWTDDEHWTATGGTSAEAFTFAREGQRLTAFGEPGGQMTALTLSPGPDVTVALRSIRQAFQVATMSQAPRFRDLVPYRIRATWLVLVLFVLQELALLVWRSAKFPAHAAFATACCAGWVFTGSWLTFAYLG